MPTVTYMLNNTTGLPEMRKYLCRSYVQLANKEFKKQFGRWPENEDAQVLYDIYEAEWRDWYIDKPLREKKNREIGKPIWQYGIRYRIDVYAGLCRFIEYKYGTLITGKYGNQYYDKSCADICEEMDIRYMETHIIEKGLLNEWKAYVDNFHSTLPKYSKRGYVDYSHLAYNGVADDF